MLILTLIWLLIQEKTWRAGFLYGLCVHLNLYTFIYAITFLFFINGVKNRVKFTIMSVLIFSLVTYGLYNRFGMQFVERFYFDMGTENYKLNYSVYWYFNYLTLDAAAGASVVMKIVMYGPQILLILSISFCFYNDLTFAMLL